MPIGEAASAVLGRSFDDVFSGRVELHELTGASHELQLEVVLSGGNEVRNFELRSWPLQDHYQNDCGRLIVFRDISNRKKAEEALRGSEERLEMVIRQMPAVLWTTDVDLRFTEMLGARLQQLRVPLDAASGMDLFEFFGTIDKTHPAIAAHMNALDGIPSTYSVEWFGRDFDCHVEPLIDRNGVSCGVIGVGLDVTERQDLQEQLRQSQKMEAIGRMAGGVAHDFNNLLTAVAGYTQLAQEDLESLESNPSAIAHLRRDLEAIGQASERATSITAQLLAFSRRQVLQPRVLQLNTVLEEMDKMIRRLIGEHIELLTFFDDESSPIKADPVQIQQVVINLVLNSRDAMPNGGKITLETRNVDLRQGRAGRYETIQPGKYVLLRVSDDGFGMDTRTQAHVFEPFFTTKEEGQGTGLGLSTVYGIIKQTGGNIEIESVLGEGTTFQIYFPVASDEEVPEGEEVTAAGSRCLRGTETLLLVEDEEMVRVLGTRVLSSHGYFVLEAEDGDEALEVCQRHEGPIDLLVTDVVMPGMNGRELAQRLATVIPDVAVLFISGYTGGALVEHGVLQDGTNFLQKPFSPHRLVQKVREVLDAHG
ncbi:MAG: response regulator [Acidobacteria bacterium]|nr:response regulator [Acidobacteriota bacterium]